MELIQPLKSNISALNQATSRLDHRFVLICSSVFLVFMMILILAIFCFIPSLEEIKERRTQVEHMEQTLNMSTASCNGKACVKIIKSSCHFGKNSDYCQIDPK